MRTKVLLLLVLLTVILLFDSSDAWGRRRRRRRSSGRSRGSLSIGTGGIRYNRGRHNIGIGKNGGSYNYRGSRWNSGVKYNRRTGGINFRANRGRHNFKAGYNHRNRNWGVGYTWRWGRRRRDLGTSEDTQKLAEIRLRELGEDVAIIKSQLSSVIPNIKHVNLPTHKGPTTNKVLARDILCLVHQFGKILPQLETFTKKMFTKHSVAYGLKVDVKLEQVAGCKGIVAPPKLAHHVLSGADLTEMKTFVGALILTQLELKAALAKE